MKKNSLWEKIINFFRNLFRSKKKRSSFKKKKLKLITQEVLLERKLAKKAYDQQYFVKYKKIWRAKIKRLEKSKEKYKNKTKNLAKIEEKIIITKNKLKELENQLIWIKVKRFFKWI